MQKVFTQRCNFAVIQLFRNYSLISHRHLHDNFRYVDYDNNRKFFFKSEKPNRFGIKLFAFPEIVTLDDEKIKKYFSNPFSEIKISTIERSISLDENKLSITSYFLVKRRIVNRKFFSKKRYINKLTINLKTGNFYTIHIHNQNKSITCNSFTQLRSKIDLLLDKKKLLLLSQTDDLKKITEISDIFNDDDFYSEIAKILNFQTLGFIKTKNDELLKKIVNKFIDIKRIKVPNEYEKLLFNHYPTEKYLKKNDRKLISSILDLYGIKSKVTIKLLHQHPDFDLDFLVTFCRMMGNTYPIYVSRLNAIKFCGATFESVGKIFIKDIAIPFDINKLSKNEIETIFNWVNNIMSPGLNRINDTIDHIKMYLKVKEYYPDVRLTMDGYDDYMVQHSELSSIITKIGKGYTIKFEFNVDMVNDIETPIELEFDEDHSLIYPTLLKTEEEYIEEGDFMHHCVGTYVDKEKSVIISLRTIDKKDRVTCEFDSQSGQLIQARHFCNGDVPDQFASAVLELSKKTKSFAKRGMLHSIGRNKIPLVINGKEVIRQINVNDQILDDLIRVNF